LLEQPNLAENSLALISNGGFRASRFTRRQDACAPKKKSRGERGA